MVAQAALMVAKAAVGVVNYLSLSNFYRRLSNHFCTIKTKG